MISNLMNLLNKKRGYLGDRLTLLLVAFSAMSAIITYITFTSSDNPMLENSLWMIIIAIVDLSLFLLLTTLIVKKINNLRLKRNAEHGFRLQSRILLMFSCVATIPTVIVAIFSTMFFHYGIESWFDKTVSTALDESVVVAESYLKEHREVLKVRAKSMAMEIDNSVIHYGLVNNIPLFSEILASLAELNSLSEAVVFYEQKPMVRTRFGLALALEIFPKDVYEKVAKGETVVIDSGLDKIRAVTMLKSIPNSYLVIGKLIDSNVIEHMHQSQGAAIQYRNIKANIASSQIRFSILFFVVSFLLLLAAVWLGITFAGYIVKPIKRLVFATERIKSGDFKFKLEEGPNDDEISILTKAFNLMTKHIDVQRDKLIAAYNEIDAKREFSEAVLSGVSSGVIALSASLRVSLINSFAKDLLNIDLKKMIGKKISSYLPEFDELLAEASSSLHNKPIHREIQLKTRGKYLTLSVRLTTERKDKKIIGYIITFDDMTELVKAQRNAAWSDVARRIAHEVKNPLTPIQLGAERLQKKYGQEIEDRTTFNKYTDTIIRHANDIRKIIEEFSSFARMPAPTAQKLNLCQIVRDAVFSRQYTSAQIKVEFNTTNEEIIVDCDQTQLNQVLNNILKNAAESIETTDRFKQGLGLIQVNLLLEDQHACIEIIDNGRGFDKEAIHKITEPYFTTRTKGTGLGMAIVKKIIDDHGGNLLIFNDEENKAHIKVILPLNR